MSRLYLILLLWALPFVSSAQTALKKYLEFADQQYQKGDYIYALDYYEKALKIDSTNVTILWKYAETLRAYKDYSKAAEYYEIVYNKESTALHPNSLLQWGLMEKQLGNYQVARELFKRGVKKYAKDKKSYFYLKCKREIESCLWAENAVSDTTKLLKINFPPEVNTENAEFAHTILNNTLYFSSLRPDSITVIEEVYDTSYTHQLFSMAWTDSISGQINKLESLLTLSANNGNGTFSLDGKRFYFSTCESSNAQYNCKIAVATFENNEWGKPELLSDEINLEGTSNTMPSIASIDGEETLVFVSNRDSKGTGDMDIFLATVEDNGTSFGRIVPVKPVNSIENELSPWYDATKKRLYFSSTWWDGFGGYDVFYSQLSNGTFQAPINVGQPINSSANDLYYFGKNDTSIVSSNRLGVMYSKNPTCCSDVFGFRNPPIPVKPVIIPKKETLEDLNKRLPVTLYFHNDVPNPKSVDITTNLNYTATYEDYVRMLPEYRKEYSKGLSGAKAQDAEEDIENFFIEKVTQGVKDLDVFKTLVLAELEKGRSIRMSVRGFASPLAKTEYNVNLTKRRIASLVNHLKVSNGGVFAPYLDGTALNGGKLEIVGVPFGEYTADQITSDNPNDAKNSIYSRAAARERKIEIQSVSYLDSDSLFLLIDVAPTSLVIGKIPSTKEYSTVIYLKSSATKEMTIDRIEVMDEILIAEYDMYVSPNRPLEIKLLSNTPFPKGIFSIPLDIYFKGFEKPIRMLVLGEGE